VRATGFKWEEEIRAEYGLCVRLSPLLLVRPYFSTGSQVAVPALGTLLAVVLILAICSLYLFAKLRTPKHRAG
jgi:hypothetical protein